MQNDSTYQSQPDSLSIANELAQPLEERGWGFLDASWTVADHTISVADVLVFLMVLLITQLVVWAVRFLINRAFVKKGPDAAGKKYTLQKLSTYFIFTLGVIVGIDTVGIDITILIAGTTALLVGVGLGIQHIFDDLVSGFIILFEGVVKVGDIIEIQGLVARVEKIDIRTTKVITRDGTYIVVPNSKITSENMTNWSMEQRNCRFQVDVGVEYGCDTALVRKILIDCAENEGKVLKTPPPRVDFVEFAESSLHFRLHLWARSTWDIDITLSDLRFEIDRQFRENDIKIPFPQRELHVTGGNYPPGSIIE